MELFKTYTSKIILANIIIYILVVILNSFLGETTVLGYLALSPENIINGNNLWSIFTSIFMHANLAHLFVNMFSLFFIGNFVEQLIGKKRFILFYLLSGIFASIFFALLSGFFGFGYWGSNIFGDPKIMGVGASGAIFGLLGFLSVITPRNRVYLIAGPLIAIVLESILSTFIPIQLSALVSILISIYFIFSLLVMFSFNPKLKRLAVPITISFWTLPIIAIVPLVLIDLIPTIDLPIGNMAHLGGLIFGLLYGFYLKKKYPNKTKMISQLFSR